ncbi:hypothetical protein [Sphingomonas sp. GC_Shp_3]|uniref:hypothetical protein n=1 Tax=Sphingomonas sp. GC_Shp_3 TaxID=2937383 RepID=UPI00226AC9B6|nr:hypothetical protein [Sphingomonas sp. GC_Shp_3]
MAEKSMIERVARELCRSDGHPENIRYEGKPMWASYAATARKVIAAMRKPTEAMVLAGLRSADAGLPNEYTAMIDAAASEVIA